MSDYVDFLVDAAKSISSADLGVVRNRIAARKAAISDLVKELAALETLLEILAARAATSQPSPPKRKRSFSRAEYREKRKNLIVRLCVAISTHGPDTPTKLLSLIGERWSGNYHRILQNSGYFERHANATYGLSAHGLAVAASGEYIPIAAQANQEKSATGADTVSVSG